GVARAAVRRRALGHAVRERTEAVGAGHMPDDEGFEALLARVGGHGAPCSPIKYPSSIGNIGKSLPTNVLYIPPPPPAGLPIKYPSSSRLSPAPRVGRRPRTAGTASAWVLRRRRRGR